MRPYIYSILLFCIGVSCADVNHSAINGQKNKNVQHRYTNHLVNESSPYLLQHAHNPVDWYPWGDAALDKAIEEDKMIIVSIGYSACHWCHVMEHESFEDTAVANLMNKHFVSIKIDREERPDIDDVYMSACHLASGGNCGWPLNAIALPDGRPFFAGTYYPKEQWMKILKEIIAIREKSPQRLEKVAESITNGVKTRELVELNPVEVTFEQEAMDDIFDYFVAAIDKNQGGRQQDIKFPMPNNWEFLLQYYDRYKKPEALNAATTTLDRMAHGGIYDQIGGGFARYSTDPAWHVPHFEKMLYDNGQLVSLYSKAYQLTKNPLYKDVVEETLGFIKRELTSPEGGFYSSLDADSEGEEGKFYVWTLDELKAALPDEEMATIVAAYYDVRPEGNWEGKNVLRRLKSDKELANKLGMDLVALEKTIEKAKKILLEKREERIRPGLDDKILTSWNALMLKGYVDAYNAFGKSEYLQAAMDNAQFLEKNAWQSGSRLHRNYKDGKSVINAFLDDYATLIEAYIALYQATFNPEWLTKATLLTDYAIAHFYNEKSGMFYYTSDIDKELIVRKMEISDNVISSSNSIMAKNLYVLGSLFYKKEYLKMSRTMVNNLYGTLSTTEQPYFYANWCGLLDWMIEPPYEVAIVGKAYKTKRATFNQFYKPNAIFLGGKDDTTLPLLEGKLIEGETRIYVCKNRSCKFPVTDVDKALELME